MTSHCELLFGYTIGYTIIIIVITIIVIIIIVIYIDIPIYSLALDPRLPSSAYRS